MERPGSTSIKTLGVLKNLDKAVATLFRKLCSTCVFIRPVGINFIDARVPSLGGDAAKNALERYSLNFGDLDVLNEHGLIISDYNSWYGIQVSIGIASGGVRPVLVRIPFQFQGKYWVLITTTQRDLGKEFRHVSPVRGVWQLGISSPSASSMCTFGLGLRRITQPPGDSYRDPFAKRRRQGI